jgi:hypothetical protein
VQNPTEGNQPVPISNPQTQNQPPSDSDPNSQLSKKPDQPAEPTSHSDEKEQTQESWFFGLIDSKTLSAGLTSLFIGSVIGFVAMMALSMYYRVNLSKNRTPLFDAPNWLRLFFPKPVNYEHEITVLCAKYLDN